MWNRIDELSLKSSLSDETNSNSKTTSNVASKNTKNANDDSQSNINIFFDMVEKADQRLDNMRTHIKNIKNIQNQILAEPVYNEDTMKNLNSIMDKFKNEAKNVKSTIDNINNQIAEDEKDAARNQTSLQIKKNQKLSLTKDLGELMTEYSVIQSQYKEQVTKRIERQAAITGKSMTYEEIEELIESGNMSTFVDQVAATEKAKQTLIDIEARHNDILNLEKNLQQLNELFVDLALLVDQQGDLIDRIDFNVAQTVDYIEKANVQLEKAVVNKRKSIKCKIILGVVIGLLILIIIISIAVSLT